MKRKKRDELVGRLIQANVLINKVISDPRRCSRELNGEISEAISALESAKDTYLAVKAGVERMSEGIIIEGKVEEKVEETEYWRRAECPECKLNFPLAPDHDLIMKMSELQNQVNDLKTKSELAMKNNNEKHKRIILLDGWVVTLQGKLNNANAEKAELQTKFDLQKDTVAGLQKQLQAATDSEISAKLRAGDAKEVWFKYPPAPEPVLPKGGEIINRPELGEREEVEKIIQAEGVKDE